jgi:hypothetical protein
MEPCSITEKLLQFNLGASGFQFLLGFFSVSLGKAFLNSLRSAVDEVFGFLQAESGQFTDSLNNLNLVSADFFQNDVEFGFFFSRSSSASTSGRRYVRCVMLFTAFLVANAEKQRVVGVDKVNVHDARLGPRSG